MAGEYRQQTAELLQALEEISDLEGLTDLKTLVSRFDFNGFYSSGGSPSAAAASSSTLDGSGLSNHLGASGLLPPSEEEDFSAMADGTVAATS